MYVFKLISIFSHFLCFHIRFCVILIHFSMLHRLFHGKEARISSLGLFFCFWVFKIHFYMLIMTFGGEFLIIGTLCEDPDLSFRPTIGLFPREFEPWAFLMTNLAKNFSVAVIDKVSMGNKTWNKILFDSSNLKKILQVYDLCSFSSIWWKSPQHIESSLNQ